MTPTVEMNSDIIQAEAGPSGLSGVLSGREPFRCSEKPLGPTLLDFWRWSESDLLNSLTRTRLAEFIVATALGAHAEGPRDGRFVARARDAGRCRGPGQVRLLPQELSPARSLEGRLHSAGLPRAFPRGERSSRGVPGAGLRLRAPRSRRAGDSRSSRPRPVAFLRSADVEARGARDPAALSYGPHARRAFGRKRGLRGPQGRRSEGGGVVSVARVRAWSLAGDGRLRRPFRFGFRRQRIFSRRFEA